MNITVSKQQTNLSTIEYCDSTVSLEFKTPDFNSNSNNDCQCNYLFVDKPDETTCILKCKKNIKQGEVFYSHDVNDTNLYLPRYNSSKEGNKNVAAIKQCTDLYYLYGKDACKGSCTIAYVAIHDINQEDTIIF